MKLLLEVIQFSLWQLSERLGEHAERLRIRRKILRLYGL